MRESTGTANITVIVIILIGVVALVGAALIPRLAGNTMYASCCTKSGGKWTQGYCIANTPTTCESRENLWNEYNECVTENGKQNANQKYKAAECTN